MFRSSMRNWAKRKLKDIYYRGYAAGYQAGTYDVGDELQVEGLYSAEIDNWTNKEGEAKQSIKVSINNPYITPADPAQLVKSLFEPTHEPTPF